MTVGENIRPIITLDGDLYDRAVKMKNYKSHWCIRLGGFHMTMAALKCLGKYAEGSGKETAWEEPGIYGSATVRQIVDGRHVYRSTEAHTVTIIALNHLLYQVDFTEEENEKLILLMREIEEACISYLRQPMGNKNAGLFETQIKHVHGVLANAGVLNQDEGIP